MLPMSRFSAVFCWLVVVLCFCCSVKAEGESAETFAVAVNPGSVTLGIQCPITVSGLSGTGDVLAVLGETCDSSAALVGEGTITSGSAPITVIGTEVGKVSICISSDSKPSGSPLASVSVVQAEVSPTSGVVGTTGTFTVTGADLSLLGNENEGGAYFLPGAAQTCSNTPPDSAVKTAVSVAGDGNSGTLTFTPSTKGTYTLCLFTKTVGTPGGELIVTDSSSGVVPKIKTVTVDPGVPINDTGIDTSAWENPFLSTTKSCEGNLGSAMTTGYFPSWNEKAELYVCATEIGSEGSSPVTTESPTLTVRNWAITPTSVLSQYDAVTGVPQSTEVTINFAVPKANIFFSVNADCSTSLESASNFNDTLKETVNFTDVHGLVYVCVEEPATKMLAIAAFLSVSPPKLTKVSLAVMGETAFTGSLAVWTPSSSDATGLYSLTEGTDSGYTYASYYVSTKRDVFLSSDSCSTPLAGTEKTKATSEGVISINVGAVADDLKEVYLCTGTPAGDGIAAVLPCTHSKMYPTTFFSGLSAKVYIPSMVSTTLEIFSATTRMTCGDASTAVTTIKTDARGVATVDMGSAASAVAVGGYAVCSGSTVVGSIEVVKPLQYGISGTLFVLNQPSVIELEGNLTSSLLIPGFTTDGSDCSTASTEYGSWKSTATNTIEVTAVKETTTAKLCARVEENDTVVELPAGSDSLRFLTSTLSLPEDGLTCGTNTITNCVAPGVQGASTTTELAIIYGACCNSEDRKNVLVKIPAGEGNCEIELSKDETGRYPSDATFSLCAFDTAAESYCVTVAANLSPTGCSSSSSISKTDIIIIVVCVVVGCLLLFALIGFFVWRRWFKKPPSAVE